MIGWDENSIAYHSDDGWCYNEKTYGEKLGKAYGMNVITPNIVGCGFNTKTKEVFFTLNGELLGEFKKENWIYVCGAIGIKCFTSILINYGDKPFKFDLIKYKNNKE